MHFQEFCMALARFSLIIIDFHDFRQNSLPVNILITASRIPRMVELGKKLHLLTLNNCRVLVITMYQSSPRFEKIITRHSFDQLKITHWDNLLKKASHVINYLNYVT